MVFDGNPYDLRIDSGQRIGAAHGILRECGKRVAPQAAEWYRSSMNACVVSAYESFEQANIFDGDVLTAVTEAQDG
jgi:hypothetical protein